MSWTPTEEEGAFNVSSPTALIPVHEVLPSGAAEVNFKVLRPVQPDKSGEMQDGERQGAPTVMRRKNCAE